MIAEPYLTVARDGWDAVRQAVFRRDVGCIAHQSRIFGQDTATDACADTWGNVIDGLGFEVLEFDHVTQHGVRYDDEAHGVSVCPRHHRLSRVWRSDSRVHRALERGWLHKHYPEVWS